MNALLDSDIPLTDVVLNLVHTCLHSRDAIISNESIHRILRTIFGHLIEEFVWLIISIVLFNNSFCLDF
jgi:hypothetical protein